MLRPGLQLSPATHARNKLHTGSDRTPRSLRSHGALRSGTPRPPIRAVHGPQDSLGSLSPAQEDPGQIQTRHGEVLVRCAKQGRFTFTGPPQISIAPATQSGQPHATGSNPKSAD